MNLAERRTLLDEFRAKLAEQHRKRYARSFDEWHDQEISFMWTLVNDARERRAFPRIDRDLVRRAESCASGHVDYALKFAVYCRDLVFSDEVKP